MVVSTSSSQAAPGDLERVRELLNTWLIPNDRRVATDHFGKFARLRSLGKADAARLKRLRDDLRPVVEGVAPIDPTMDRWIAEVDVRPVLRDGRLWFSSRGGAAGKIIKIVLGAVIEGDWRRLKACPDCRWVFYDHTRNASKRWCLMNAGGPQGRGCGTIAKVRRHRERETLASSAGHR